MTEKDQNDPMAAERARSAFAALEGDAANRMRGLAAAYADTHVITWEQAVNTAGVPVRRYVARSAWEVDPERAPDLARLARIDPGSGT